MGTGGKEVGAARRWRRMAAGASDRRAVPRTPGGMYRQKDRTGEMHAGEGSSQAATHVRRARAGVSRLENKETGRAAQAREAERRRTDREERPKKTAGAAAPVAPEPVCLFIRSRKYAFVLASHCGGGVYVTPLRWPHHVHKPRAYCPHKMKR